MHDTAVPSTSRSGRGWIPFALDGEERTLAVEVVVTVVPGGWHRWWNAGEGEVETHPGRGSLASPEREMRRTDGRG